MNVVGPLFAALFSVLVPSKMWYPPSQPDEIQVKSQGDVTLTLTDFAGKTLPAKGEADVQAGKTIDAKAIFPQLSTIGTYVLYAVPKGKTLPDFEGTPIVIEVRGDKERGDAEPMVTKVEPLQYAVMETKEGAVTMAFYYDVAPITVESFVRLAEQGYYDGLTFHRILPDFVIQGGDPKGNGTGGPGYTLPAEFNNHKHEPGVLSMARTSDPNSGGSQFFVCLNYEKTKHLDHQYTAFGEVTDGMNAVMAIAHTPLSDADQGTPAKAPVIQKITVKPVTAKDDPYLAMMNLKK